MSDINQDSKKIEPIVNRVANSSLLTLNLEDYLFSEKILELDIKDFLFKGMLLREGEFKEAINAFDFSIYDHQTVAIFCSTNALIQQWAYMLIAKELSNAKSIYFGTVNDVSEQLLVSNIRAISETEFIDKKVMVRGCGDKRVTGIAYLEIAKKLLPVVKNLSYGEVCSNVPIFKRKK